MTAPQRYTHIRTTRIARTLNGGCRPRPSGRLNALVGPIASAVSAPGHDVSARRQRELKPCRLERGEQLIARDQIAAHGCHRCQHRVAFSRPYQRLDHPACEPLCCQTSAGCVIWSGDCGVNSVKRLLRPSGSSTIQSRTASTAAGARSRAAPIPSLRVPVRSNALRDSQ